MTLRTKPKFDRILTEVELEVMNVIWDLEECTVRQVQAALSSSRDLAYTSVATMMKILEQKGVVKSVKKEKAHVYLPMVPRQSYESLAVKHITENVFRGNPTSMMMRLLDETSLTKNEIEAIRKILEKGADA